MLRKIIPFLFIGFLSLSFNSCSDSFTSIQKSTDPEFKYKKAFEFYEAEDYYKAEVLLEELMSIYRGGPRTEKLYYHFAYCQYHLKQYVSASYHFKRFYTLFPNSELAEEALYMSGFSNYELSPNSKLDQSYTSKAIEDFQLFTNTFPKSEYVAKCNDRIDEMRLKLEEKAYNQAELYYRLGEYKAAVHSYQLMLNDFPDSGNVEEARFKLIKATYKLALNSVEVKKIERFKETIDFAEEFTAQFPNSKFSKEANSIAESASQKLKKIDS